MATEPTPVENDLATILSVAIVQAAQQTGATRAMVGQKLLAVGAAMMLDELGADAVGTLLARLAEDLSIPMTAGNA